MSNKKKSRKQSNNKPIIIVSIIFALVLASMALFSIFGDSDKKTVANNNQSQLKGQTTAPGNSQAQSKGDVPSGVDLKILKSEVTETVKFYPYKVDKVNMEVLAVKAKDGTIRTALNTCQVCYASGKGYYVQKGETIVCQNCGNVFRIDQIENIKGGCNPVPATGDDKKDDGTNIVISKTFLAESKNLFLKWGKK
jgi:nitrite reductase/ring-hydroxylating ferredoxin subunit